MADITDLNKVQYAGLDFDTIEDDLRGRLQVQFAADFNDFSLSSLGIMLLDVIAFGLDTLSFYLDRRATDNFLSTARTRKSVAKLCRQLGYKMGAATAANLDLNVSLQTGGYGFNVPIPKGFQFLGPNELIFEVAETVTFPASFPAATALSVPVYQGETVSETFTSDGTPNQVFSLRKVPSGAFVVAGSVTTLVAGAPFVEKDFLEFEASDQFEIGYNDSPVTLRFGDGNAGNIPTLGSTITCTYVASSGKAGQVSGGTITKERVPLVVAFTTIPLTISNPTPSIGGDDPEDLAHAKSFAGRVFKSRQVAVTKEDYQALAGSFADPLFGRVAVAQAVSSRSAATDLELQTLLASIESAVSAYAPTARNRAFAIEATMSAILSALSTDTSGIYKNLLFNLTSIAATATGADTSAVSSLSTAKTAKNRSADVTSNASSLQTQVTALQAAVAAIPVGGSDTLLTATKTALQAFITDTLALTGLINSNSAIVDSSLNSVVSSFEDIDTKIRSIGLDLTTPGSLVYAAAQNRLAVLGLVGSSTVPSGVYALTADISSHVTTDVDSPDGTVFTATKAILDHVDHLLAADCKANVVSVPILAKNAGGFYSAPSISLMKSLQKYLDARKEVTQTVFVTSGAGFLVQPVGTVRVGVKKTFSTAVIQASVSTAIDGLLRDRAFGASLFVSDIVDVIMAIPGVVFSNVKFTGYSKPGDPALYTDKLDVSGNIIIDFSEVITKNVITDDLVITTEVAL